MIGISLGGSFKIKPVHTLYAWCVTLSFNLSLTSGMLNVMIILILILSSSVCRNLSKVEFPCLTFMLSFSCCKIKVIFFYNSVNSVRTVSKIVGDLCLMWKVTAEKIILDPSLLLSKLDRQPSREAVKVVVMIIFTTPNVILWQEQKKAT